MKLKLDPSFPRQDTGNANKPAAPIRAYGGAAPVVRNAQDGLPSSREFEKRHPAQAQAIRTQYRQGIGSLKTLMEKHGARRDIGKLDTLAKNLVAPDDPDEDEGSYSQRLIAVKPAFDKLLRQIEDPATNEKTKVDHVAELVQVADLCEANVADTIQMLPLQLEQATGGTLQGKARNVLHDMTMEAARSWVAQAYGKLDHYEAAEAYYVGPYFNHLAKGLNLPKVPEFETIPDFAYTLPTFDKATQGAVTANKLVSRMAEECLQRIHQDIARIEPPLNLEPGKPMSLAQCAEAREKVKAILPALSQQYGDIDLDQIFPEHQDGNAAPSYSLVSNDSLLQHRIGKNLRDAGVLQGFKSEYVLGAKGDKVAIKQVGDTLYARERLGAGAAVNRPLTNAQALDAALEMTDPEALSKVPGAQVMAALQARHAADPAGILNDLMSPGMQRYRAANFRTPNSMMDRVAARLGDIPARKRADAFGHIMDNTAARMGQLTARIRTVAPEQRAEGFHQVSKATDYTMMRTLARSMGQEDASLLKDPRLLRSALRDPEALRVYLNDVKLDANFKDADGVSLLSMACQTGSAVTQTAAQILLGAGADAATRDKNGFDALMHLVKSGQNAKWVESLTTGQQNRNCDVNRRLPDGTTPLTLAIGRGSDGPGPAMVEALIARGADVTKADPDTGMTPLKLAMQARNAPVVDMLVAHGAVA